MVRRDIASTRIGRAMTWLQDAETLFGPDVETFLAATKDRDLAIFYLFLALQECIDLAAHWVADAGWGTADDAGSTFDVLAERGAIDHALAGSLRAATGLRNRIAHGYAMLDYRRVQIEAHEGLPALRGFLAAVAQAAGL